MVKILLEVLFDIFMEPVFTFFSSSKDFFIFSVYIFSLCDCMFMCFFLFLHERFVFLRDGDQILPE